MGLWSWYKGKAAETYATVDQIVFGGVLPNGAPAPSFAWPTPGEIEAGIRGASPFADKQGRGTDFVVGLYRIGSDTVGKNGNPSYKAVWGKMDDRFHGWLPGGKPPEPPLDIPWPVIIGGAALVVLAVKS